MTSNAPRASWGALAIFRNSLPPRIARADAAIRITIRLSRCHRRRRRRSPLARTTRVSPMRPSASRPEPRRLVARARVWVRSCRACVRVTFPWSTRGFISRRREMLTSWRYVCDGIVNADTRLRTGECLLLSPSLSFSSLSSLTTRACVRLYMCDGIWG